MAISYEQVFALFKLDFYPRLLTSTLVALCVCNAMGSSCQSDYNVSSETLLNRHLDGNPIFSSKTIGRQMCVKECLERNCHSINFNKATLECELNSKDHQSLQNETALQEHSEFSFTNVSIATTKEGEKLWPSAKNNPQQQNYVCITLKSKKIACVEEDVRSRDCKDIRARGYTADGVYTLYPTENMATRAYCDMTTDTDGWTVFQRRKNGKTDFYRHWKDYREGFGNPDGEYWLGNRYLYKLTNNRTCQLKIILLNWDNVKRYAMYEDFGIGHENDGFRLSIGNYSGNAGHDSLRYQNGQMFTTRDRDNDRRSYDKCAVVMTGAWWYNDCYHSNLNGNYSVRSDQGVKWYEYPLSDFMKDTVMQVKCN